MLPCPSSLRHINALPLPCRWGCAAVLNHRHFDNVILAVICFSSICLAIDSPDLNGISPGRITISEWDSKVILVSSSSNCNFYYVHVACNLQS